jgi:CubicO group peptidase (beta-lactamase class C family)
MDIYGFCDPKFLKIKDAYSKNFINGLDVGSSLGITYKGELVVNLWGGFKDRNKTSQWEEDTIINVWSSTKNMASLCVYILAERGLINFHDPISKYWPEFSNKGKQDVLISHVMSHSSGLSGWKEPIKHTDFYNWDKVCSLLANQKPFWEPGKAVGYHAITIGYLVGELIRRVSGKSIGKFFKDEIANPLKSDFHIGLKEKDFNRVADIFMPGEITSGDLFESEDIESEIQRAQLNPSIDPVYALEDDWRKSEIPAAGGHGNGKSLAECMALVANNGEFNKQKIFSKENLDNIFLEQILGIDLVFNKLTRWGIGFALPVKNNSWMGYFNNEQTCYWTGWGGSLSIADRENNSSLGYTPLKMEEDVFGEERTNSIVSAYVESLENI